MVNQVKPFPDAFAAQRTFLQNDHQGKHLDAMEYFLYFF
jgi:hypothetical protein